MHSNNISNLREFDNDKYLALFFAPVDRKEQLAALFNFHYEVSQIPLEVSENMVGMIKIQWWRDCLEELREGKPPRPHPVLKGLAGAAVSLDQLDIVLNNYEKLLDDWKPRTITELADFVAHTDVIIFEQAANIMGITYSVNSAKAYGYTKIARKLPGDKAQLARQLVEESEKLQNGHNSVFDIITRYYNRNLKAPRWKLLLKLAFSRAKFL